VWASSANDVFVVNTDFILHWNGSAWRLTGHSWFLHGVWGRSSSDVFAVGINGTIVHYNGRSWTEMNSGTDASLTAISGHGDKVFAVGDRVIMRYSP